MKALCIETYGSLNGLKLMDIQQPTPGKNQVRVDIVSSALNPADNKVALGEVKFLHGRQFPLCLGYDFSGVVGKVGPHATRFKVGDEVFGFLPYGPMNQQGTLAESVVTPEDQIALKPRNVSHQVAAAAATSGLTALQALRNLGKVRSASRVLITGVSGGVGSLALRVAKELGATEVIAVGSGRGLDLAPRMGATRVLDRKRQNVFAESLEGGLDVVFDAASAYRWASWRTHLNPGGTYITTLPSASFAIDKLRSLFANSAVEFVNVKSKSEDLALLAGWLESGIYIPIDSTISLQEVGRHLDRLRHGQVLGKVVVNIR